MAKETVKEKSHNEVKKMLVYFLKLSFNTCTVGLKMMGSDTKDGGRVKLKLEKSRKRSSQRCNKSFIQDVLRSSNQIDSLLLS